MAMYSESERKALRALKALEAKRVAAVRKVNEAYNKKAGVILDKAKKK